MKKILTNLALLLAGATIGLIITISCLVFTDEDEEVEEFSLNKDYTTTNYETTINYIKTENTETSCVIEETLPPVTEPETPDTEITETSQSAVDNDDFNYIPMSQSLKDHVELVSSFYGFSEELIYQIIYRESGFNPKASNGRCVGLMQVHTDYSNYYLSIDDGLPFEISENSDIYDPYVNIVVGVRVLSDWRRMGSQRGFDKLNDWLCYYNMGWIYEDHGSNGYDSIVLTTDLESIDFSRHKIIE